MFAFVVGNLVTIHVTRIAKTPENKASVYSVSSLKNSYTLESQVGYFAGEFTLAGIAKLSLKLPNFQSKLC